MRYLLDLADGPVWVASTCQEQVEFLSSLDRRAIVTQFNAGATGMHPEEK